MRISVKNTVISFAISLVIFSIVMAIIGVSVFRDSVDEHLVENGGISVEALPLRESIYDFSRCEVYYSEENGALACAVIVGISDSDRMITVTSIDGTLPIPFQTSNYFVSHICEIEGVNALVSIAEALTGMHAQSVISAKDGGISSASSLNGLTDGVEAYLKTKYSGYGVIRISVKMDGDGIADVTKTAEEFFKIESN